MISPLASAIVFVCAGSMASGVAEIDSGVVIAAPHEGFDEHTSPIAKSVAGSLGAGWVVANGYRDPARQQWIDVNRPTQREYVGGKAAKGKVTRKATKVYERYQRLLRKAGKRKRKAPLELLVEIHGHARVAMIGGQRVRVRVIELATRGFSEEALKGLKARYEILVAALPARDRIPLLVEQLDPTFTFRGQELKYHFRASGAKKRGSLRAESAKRILHFELPQAIRFKPNRREAYAALFSDLLRSLP
jgi:hypothetical protein